MARDLPQREQNSYIPTLDREDLNRISETLKTHPRNSEASSAVPGCAITGLGDTLAGHLWEGDTSPGSTAQFRKEPNHCNYIIYKQTGGDVCFHAGLNCKTEQSLSKHKRKKRNGEF